MLVALFLVVTVNVPGVGARTTAPIEMPQRYASMLECQQTVKRLAQLNDDKRHIEAVCRMPT